MFTRTIGAEYSTCWLILCTSEYFHQVCARANLSAYNRRQIHMRVCLLQELEISNPCSHGWQVWHLVWLIEFPRDGQKCTTFVFPIKLQFRSVYNTCSAVKFYLISVFHVLSIKGKKIPTSYPNKKTFGVEDGYFSMMLINEFLHFVQLKYF